MVTRGQRVRRRPGPDDCVRALDWLQSLPDADYYFDERGYCEAALKFANSRTADEQLPAILELTNDHKWKDAPVYWSEEARTKHAEKLESDRQQFIEQLVRVMGHRGAGRLELAREVRKRGDRVLISERTIIRAGGYQIARRVQSFNPADGLSHALLVLINPAYANFGECLGDELCRCRLASCEKFFFAYREGKSGPPRREYCCAEHRDTWRRANGTVRVRQHRARKARSKK